MADKNSHPHLHVALVHCAEHIPQPTGIQESDLDFQPEAAPLTEVGKATDFGPKVSKSLGKQASRQDLTHPRVSESRKENIVPGAQLHQCQVSHFSSEEPHYSHGDTKSVPIPSQTLTMRAEGQSRGSTSMMSATDSPRGCMFLKSIVWKKKLIALWRPLKGWPHK